MISANRKTYDMSPHDEASLVQRARTGDRDAFRALWDELTPKLFGYLVNTLRDRTIAEDILQNTWLKALKALPRYEQRGARISAWLFAIARNECREHWRKSGREAPFNLKEHDTAGNIDSTHEEKFLIEQILSSLSEADRDILRLRYIVDLSMRDIAKVLNLNFITVRVRVHRALTRARAEHASHRP